MPAPGATSPTRPPPSCCPQDKPRSRSWTSAARPRPRGRCCDGASAAEAAALAGDHVDGGSPARARRRDHPPRARPSGPRMSGFGDPPPDLDRPGFGTPPPARARRRRARPRASPARQRRSPHRRGRAAHAALRLHPRRSGSPAPRSAASTASAAPCTVQLDGEPVARLPDARRSRPTGATSRRSRASSPAACRQAFHEHHALQCGFCTAGILMTLDAYLRRAPRADRGRSSSEALAGNLCRCTGYAPIIEAVLRPMKLRSQYDREILLLALPALGALAAEPLYVLVDTAIVGHLGTTQLASLAIAATVLSDRVHDLQLPHLRHDGAGRAPARRGPRRGRRGARLAGAVAGARDRRRPARAAASSPRPAIVGLMGGEGEVEDGAVLYLRISALGAPLFMLASRGPGLPARDGRPADAAADPRRRPHRQRRASSCCSSTASTGAWRAPRGAP